ncbi:MAG: hypothetical protein MPJ50_06440 [Pirellulales bacterium]|nr:hypothetical protein [Pirellulales bacterium]
MARHLAICVKQLNLASAELHLNDAQCDRIALILIDNTIEIILQNYLPYYFEHPPIVTLTSKQRKNLNRTFAPKVDFVRSRFKLREDDAEFCKQAHAFRNESYHQAALHDIGHELACVYLGLTCRVLVRLTPTNRHVAVEAVQALDSHWAQTHRTLQQACSESAGTRVQAIHRSLAQIAKLTSGQPSQQSILESIQSRIEESKQVTLDTLEAWRRRGRRLRRRQKPGALLQQYVQLIDEIATLEDHIDDVLDALDLEMDELIDWLRDALDVGVPSQASQREEIAAARSELVQSWFAQLSWMGGMFGFRSLTLHEVAQTKNLSDASFIVRVAFSVEPLESNSRFWRLGPGTLDDGWIRSKEFEFLISRTKSATWIRLLAFY